VCVYVYFYVELFIEVLKSHMKGINLRYIVKHILTLRKKGL
jgi:hypothetical protein